MTRLTMLAILLLSLVMAHAQPTNSFPLWPGGAPGALGSSPSDIPTLTVYQPAPGKANGAAMVICPGGGYGVLAKHEGEDYARWLNESGITCFVVKYRLGSAGYRHPAMLNDAARAVRTVRARASDWGIDPRRVGIIGSSAGGHLASTLLTHFDAGHSNAVDVIERESSRPDVGILCYAVISLGEFRHAGSRDNLLGKTPAPELVEQLSNELQVTTNTPPCFVWSTEEDKTVKVENSMMFAAALRRNKVPFDLHIYQKGGHGMGIGARDGAADKRHPWTGDCIYWLKERGFVK